MGQGGCRLHVPLTAWDLGLPSQGGTVAWSSRLRVPTGACPSMVSRRSSWLVLPFFLLLCVLRTCVQWLSCTLGSLLHPRCGGTEKYRFSWRRFSSLPREVIRFGGHKGMLKANLHLAAAADDKPHYKLDFFVSLWRSHEGSPAQLGSRSLRTSEQ